MLGKDWRKRYVLRRRRKTGRDGDDWMSDGNELQRSGAATGNVRRPTVVSRNGLFPLCLSSLLDFCECECRRRLKITVVDEGRVLWSARMVTRSVWPRSLIDGSLSSPITEFICLTTRDDDIYAANGQFTITHSLFHSRLKTSLFCKSFPLQPFLSFFRTDYMIPQNFTVTSEHIRFYFLVFLFFILLSCWLRAVD